MKKQRLISLCLLCAFILSGCKNKTVDENAVDNTQVGISNTDTVTGAAEDAATETERKEVDPNDVKAKDMEALTALTFEEIAANQALSADAKENMVYQYVSDTVTVDTDPLVQVTDDEKLALENVVTQVNDALYTGQATNISEDMLNYILWEMANTPYAWQYDSMEIKGIDAATRLYFVDVKYKTTEQYKELIPDSVIVRGAPNEENLKAKRYSDYLVWLDSVNAGADVYTKWQQLIDDERASANAMSVFAYGLQYDSVMDGYTADAKSTETDDNTMTDTFIDANGEERLWTDFTFEDRWGSLDDIFATQDGVTLVERLQEYNYRLLNEKTSDTAETETNTDIEFSEDIESTVDESESNAYAIESEVQQLGVYTYGGLTEVARDYGAEMTFRMVFKYTYSISTDNAMELQSVYLYDYALNNSDELRAAYTTDTIQNGEALTPFIEKTVKSYRKALEESNHVGLYSLFVTYDKYDTYVADLLNYAYINNGGFSTELIGRKGDEVALIVTQRTQKRAKGTYMSMPTYQEEVLMKVKLCADDTVRIVSITTLNSMLIGEPLSIIRDVTGVSDQIAYDASAFTQSNAVAVEQVIGAFEAIQLAYNGKELATTDFNTLDLGMSSTEKTNMLNAFNAINQLDADKVAVWLTNYETKSNLYVSVKLREVFYGAQNNLDSEATVGLINRNGDWKVISYTRTLAIPTAVVDIETFKKNCLLIVDETEKQKVTFYNATDVEGVSGDSGIDFTNNEDSGWDIEKQPEETQLTEEGSVQEPSDSTNEHDDGQVTENNTSESPTDDVLGGLF